MTVVEQAETLNFQTEVKQLLHLMIHSLYSNKEIFLRELVSNASDAADKLRFEALSDNALFEGDDQLKIRVSFDKDKKTITISDNGIGMNRHEIIENLGTIARSGTREFLAKMTSEQTKDSHMIGQFGVGFYSSFIVAKQVEVFSRRAGLNPEHGVYWSSAGEGEYQLKNIEKQTRGTDIVLHLRDDEEEFLDDLRLRNIVRKYSDHIAIPIVMEKIEAKEDEDKEETVNRAKALWTMPKSKIKDEEYTELYKHISHDFEDPLTWGHNKVEGNLQYTSLLYLPKRAPFDLWNREHKHGLKLYVQRVFILDDAEQFLPMYLRFVKGVVDTSDLPLNISRELLQNNRVIDKMHAALTKRVLSMLEELAEKDVEKYYAFWDAFGQVLKEGPAEDFGNRDRIAKLLRFATTHDDKRDQRVSFDDYIKRMQPKQEHIYYITADSFEAAKNSPHLEVFRKKGIEVLILSDRVDEWLVAHLAEFDGKKLQSVAKGDLDLGELEEEKDQKAAEEDFKSVVEQMKEVLGESVKEVRVTSRLTDSPSCIVVDEDEMGTHMQRLMQAAGQQMMASKPIFEINPEHRLVAHLKSEQDDERFAEWTRVLFDQAVLAEGGQLQNPASFVKRVNALLGG
ncbi:MAG: molecular chaperone HtpG [Gammaproteobacteria bacterium]